MFSLTLLDVYILSMWVLSALLVAVEVTSFVKERLKHLRNKLRPTWSK